MFIETREPMTSSFRWKQSGPAAACALALFMMSGAAAAQTAAEETSPLIDGQGAVVMSGFGLCWRTASGTAALSARECEPDYLAPTPARRTAPAAQPGPVATLTPPPAPRHPPLLAFAIPPAAVPAIEKVVLDADALFDFDKAGLNSAGRAVLDDFAVRLRTITPGMIRLVGHADRLGSEAYNQILSEERAEAVKDYLVSKDVDPKRVRAEGKGDTQPVTKAGACDGGRSAKVIACLQPDRRVVIEVAGTRTIK